MKIQFKFHEHADAEARRRVLDELDPDVQEVEQLFPDEADPELATLYVADLAEEQATKALAALKRAKAVEFAEPQADRKLHLPEELEGR